MKIAYQYIIVITCLISIFNNAVAGPNYESSWHEDFHLEISKTLAKNNIRDCGQYKYKTNLDYPNKEFLVFCTKDGSSWTAYQVWTLIGKVEGPFKADSNFK